MRSHVLATLGVLKVATADQVRRLTCPGHRSNKAVRNACLDLAKHGLTVSEGNTRDGQKLWGLTPHGLDTEPDILPDVDHDTGIDLGLSAFAVLSDGTKIHSPRFLRRAEKKLKRLQRELSRKAKGSKNRAKARIKVARRHAKVADRRRDWHHKASTQIIRDNQAVFVEDLAVSGLGRTRLAKSVYDAGWSAFVDMLEYKAALHGRTFAKVDRAFPSSQICSACGLRDGPKPLHVREWTCGECGTVHDRDHNAARNILYEGRRIVAAGRTETPNACGAPVRRAHVPAQRDEAGSPRKGQPTQAGIPGL